MRPIIINRPRHRQNRIRPTGIGEPPTQDFRSRPAQRPADNRSRLFNKLAPIPGAGPTDARGVLKDPHTLSLERSGRQAHLPGCTGSTLESPRLGSKQRRKHRMTNRTPGPRKIRIGRILAPFKPALAAERPALVTANLKHRPNQLHRPEAPNRGNPPQPRDPGSTRKPKQQSLELIVRMMGCRDERQIPVLGQNPQRLVPGGGRIGFEIPRLIANRHRILAER